MDQEHGKPPQAPTVITLSQGAITSQVGRSGLVRLVMEVPLNPMTPITLELPDGRTETYLSRRAVLTMIEWSRVYLVQPLTQTTEHSQVMEAIQAQANREEEARQLMGLLIKKLKESYR